MLTLNDGRTELWQWDTGRKLTVDVECSQVHFSNKIFGRSIDVDVVNGVANIPDILLQTDKELTAWAFVGTLENGYTKISKVFKVNKRNKPADYVFTPTEQVTLDKILDRLKELEERPIGEVDPEEIKNIVDEYLQENPVEVEETDPTVPEWAKSKEKPTYTANEVGAQPKGDYALKNEIPKIPTKLPNPNKLIFSGTVSAEYDGTKEVEVDIPASKGIEVSGAVPGQFLKVSAVDENGHPTAWETVDPASVGFRHIRTVTIPEDITADTSGVMFAEASDGGINFLFDMDESGNAFKLNEVYIKYIAGNSTGAIAKTFRLITQNISTNQKTNILVQAAVPVDIDNSRPGWIYYSTVAGAAAMCMHASQWATGLMYASAISALDLTSLGAMLTTGGFTSGSRFEFYGR